MTVGALLRTLDSLRAPGASTDATSIEVPCTAVAYDSRRARPGSIFVALRGANADGTVFVAQAVANGAMAVVAERAPDAPPPVPSVVVTDARLALALLSASFFDHPSHEMQVVGITGTNGKTTTSYLLHAIFEAAGISTGLMGTVTTRIGTLERDATRTTPEAPDLQSHLRDMRAAGCAACVMEVSSHALALKRADGVRFAAGVFTNLTRDHLDFHEDMDRYFAAKRRLFEMLPADAPALINVDDPRAPALLEVSTRPVTYGITRPADVSPGPLSYSLEGLRFDVRTPQGTMAIRSPLVGRPNVLNILAAVGTASTLGLPLGDIERGVRELRGVPGRFELVSTPADDIAVVIDYAHTDDALRNLLETARPLAARRLITVFGAGGARDRSKRPLMGMVAARLSDVVVITSDNPRHEDPDRIIEEIRLGVDPEARQSQTEVRVIPDRREAVCQAIGLAAPGDVVLVAGKGHEKYQEVAGTQLPHDDCAVALQALEARRPTSRVG